MAAATSLARVICDRPGPLLPPEKPRLLDCVRLAIRTRHHSPKTEKAYVRWIREFVLFHGKRHPAELGGPEIARYLSHLATVRGVGPSTQNQALSALRFLYREILELDLAWVDGIVRAKRPSRLPVVLRRDEVEAILREMRGTSRLVAMLRADRSWPSARAILIGRS